MDDQDFFHQFSKDPDNIAELFTHMNDGVMVTDADKRIILINPAYEKITGYTLDEMYGEDPSYIASGHTPRSVFHDMWETIREKGTWTGELINRRKNGEEFWSYITITYMKKDQPEESYYIGLIRDITEQKQHEKVISHMAYYDALTETPNRVHFHRKAKEVLMNAEEHGEKVAVLFLDLDRFKKINDSLGHYAGDELLHEVAQRLLTAVGKEGFVSRFGGDEFAILIDQAKTTAEMDDIIFRVFKKVSEPIKLQNQEIFITVSIGVSIYPDHGKDIDTLLRNADFALYQTKDAGRNNYFIFENDPSQQTFDRLALETDLRKINISEQLEVFYQLQMDIQTGKVYGTEALIRWNHPEKGLLTPNFFLPIAEETGFIKEIDEWVLAEACRQTQYWRENGHPDLMVSVNVSKSLFESPYFVKTIRNKLDKAGLPPENLILEISENIKITDLRNAARKLQPLREMGITVSLDDFGTGYSSIGQLKRFPIDNLKIDKSFVMETNGNDKDAAIITFIINMANSLNFTIVCEGVETEEQLAFVKKEGCQLAQGYLYSKPVTAAECAQLLEDLR